MANKPRQQLRLEAHLTKVRTKAQERQEEFKNCDSPGCPNVIATWTLPRGYSGLIYCRIHSHIAEKN
jgi:hypothetical protein